MSRHWESALIGWWRGPVAGSPHHWAAGQESWVFIWGLPLSLWGHLHEPQPCDFRVSTDLLEAPVPSMGHCHRSVIPPLENFCTPCHSVMSSDLWAATYSSHLQAPGDASHQVPRACLLEETLCYLVQWCCVSLTALCTSRGTCIWFSSSLKDYKILESRSICSYIHEHSRKHNWGRRLVWNRIGVGAWLVRSLSQ